MRDKPAPRRRNSKKKRLWSHDAPPQALVLSGAGLSVESGLATFRGAGGLWAGADIRRVCSADTWRKHFEEVHEFYNARRAELATVEPNAAHRALADLAKATPTTMLTQNADDLLERAGCPDVIHLHGTLSDMSCVGCGHGWDVGCESFAAGEDRCPKCGSRKGVRPGIVMFGDRAPNYATMHKAFASLRPSDALLVVGTSGQVVDPYEMAASASCLKVVCDPNPPGGLDDPDAMTPWTVFAAPASEATPKAVEKVREHLRQPNLSTTP